MIVPHKFYSMKKLLILLTLAVAGCQQGGAPLTSADTDAIKKNVEAFAQAIRTASPDVGNNYVDGVVSMPPHAAVNVGKQKTVEFHLAPGPKVTSFTITSEEIDGSADLAYSRGSWVFKGVVNDSIEINDNGKYLVLMKKQGDGSWKVTHEIWNSDVALPGQ
jgi:ketosteroid isomerase-like protein